MVKVPIFLVTDSDLHRHPVAGALGKMAANFDELIANGYKVMNADLEPESKKFGTKITLRVSDASDMMRDVWKVGASSDLTVARVGLLFWGFLRKKVVFLCFKGNRII